MNKPQQTFKVLVKYYNLQWKKKNNESVYFITGKNDRVTKNVHFVINKSARGLD